MGAAQYVKLYLRGHYPDDLASNMPLLIWPSILPFPLILCLKMCRTVPCCSNMPNCAITICANFFQIADNVDSNGNGVVIVKVNVIVNVDEQAAVDFDYLRGKYIKFRLKVNIKEKVFVAAYHSKPNIGLWSTKIWFTFSIINL